MKTALLITERFDPAVDGLLADLRMRGVPCLRWNMDSFPLGSTLTYRASADRFSGEIVSDGRRLDLGDIGGVWWRGVPPSGLPADLRAEEREFAATEARFALVALMTVGSFHWINHPSRDRLANAKPAQLCVARQVGLRIPRTVITNDPDEARSFAASVRGETVYKPLSQALAGEPDQALFSGVLTEKEQANLDFIQWTPGIFQERVAKTHELRVTVVGARLFSVKIESQSNAATTLDWRRAPFDIAYEAIEIPSAIATKIRAVMETFGLIYGAFDFIVTPEGDYVFLEVNPAGQYLWLEAMTGLPITAAIADALAEPCSHA